MSCSVFVSNFMSKITMPTSLPCQIIKCSTEYTYHLLAVGIQIHCPVPACGWLRNSHKTNYAGLYQMHSQMFCPISISNAMSNSFHKVRSHCDIKIFTRCVMPINFNHHQVKTNDLCSWLKMVMCLANSIGHDCVKRRVRCLCFMPQKYRVLQYPVFFSFSLLYLFHKRVVLMSNKYQCRDTTFVFQNIAFKVISWKRYIV